jgi:dihydroxyacetone kinase
MKKFINNVEDILTESLNGFALSHSDILRMKLPAASGRGIKTD